MAFELTDDCSHCLPELYRRRAYLRRDQKRCEEALSDAEKTEPFWRHVVRAHVFIEKEDFPQVVESCESALGLLTPEDPRYDYVQFNLAVAVCYTDDSLAAVQRVRGILRQVRGKKEFRHGVGHAKLVWLDGQVHFRLGANARAETLFKQGLEELTELGLVQEKAALSADAARVELVSTGDQPGSVQRLRTVVTGRMRDVLDAQDLPENVRDAARAVREAVNQRPLDAVTLNRAIHALRKAATGPHVMPSIIF